MKEERQEAKTTEKVEKKETKPVEKKQEKKATDKKVETEVKKVEKKQDLPKDAKKKFENAKSEKKKTNTGIIIAATVAVLVIIAIIAYMFLMASSPKKAVDAMLSDLKEGSYSQAILSNMLGGDSLDQDSQKLLFERLEWNILNVNEEGDKATVEVEITNKDFKAIMENYMQKILKTAIIGQSVNQEQMTKYLMEELGNQDVENVTVNRSITVEKQNGKWEVSEENDLVNILLPGFNETIDAFTN